jgi:membrane protease YdiL (CAAX protease family)
MTGQASLARILAGYALLLVAFDGAGRLLDGLGLAAGKSLTAAVGVAAALAVESLLHRGRGLRAVLKSLGYGAPDLGVMGVSVTASVALLASMPLVFRLAGTELVLPDSWPLLALGIFLLNGAAEETIYRGYLFRHLRERHTFGRAVLVGSLLAALAHAPIVVSAGWAVGLIAVLVAVLTFLPFATLFERGGNAIWAPAAVHFAADCIIPLGALGLATPLAIGYWMGAQVAACYLALVLARRAHPGAAARPRTATS